MESDTIRLEVELTESPRNTILLGYEIGSAELDPGRKLTVTGSGKIVRFEVYAEGKKIKSYDLDLTPIAAEVVRR